MLDRFNQSRQLIYNVLAVVLSLFVLAAVNANLFDEQPNLALFGMLGLLLVFLSQPLIKSWSDKLPFRILDVVLILATTIVFGYVFVQSERLLKMFWVDGTLLGDRAGNESPGCISRDRNQLISFDVRIVDCGNFKLNRVFTVGNRGT